MRALRAAPILLLFLLLPAAAAAQVPGVARVRHVPDPTLNDAALAVADSRSPVVYYNPTLLSRFGPDLAAFVMAHEYGHIAHGHARVRTARGSETPQAIMQRFELEADCYAAGMLGESNPGAVRAAIAYFDRMGDRQVDEDHPTGTDRAAELRRCLPDAPQLTASTPVASTAPTASTTGTGAGAGLVERR